jgi:hypothetical protein
MKNKKFWILLILIILFVLGSIVFYLLYYSPRISKYENYKAFSTTKSQKDFEVSINAFLESITEQNGEKCINLLTIDKELQSFQVCEDLNLVNWENTYEDYSELIPVNVLISFNKNLSSIYLVENIEVTLLEDDDYMFFFDLWDGKDPNIHVRIKSSEEVKRKGYYLNGTSKSGDKLFLTISENTIDQIELENGEIVIYFTSTIEGQKIKLKTIINQFVYFEEESRDIEELNITEQNIEILEINKGYSFMFNLKSDFSLDENIKSLLYTEYNEDYSLFDLTLFGIIDYTYEEK